MYLVNGEGYRESFQVRKVSWLPGESLAILCEANLLISQYYRREGNNKINSYGMYHTDTLHVVRFQVIDQVLISMK